MIPLLLALSLPTDLSPWDQCADGDGAACWQVSQSLDLEDGQPSKRAQSLALRSCTLGHDPACAELISDLPERPRREQATPLVGACIEGASSACDWVQAHFPADFSAKQSAEYCEKRDCDPQALIAMMPGQWRLHTPAGTRDYGEPVGAWVPSTKGRETSYTTQNQSIWMAGRGNPDASPGAWIRLEMDTDDWQWWNPETGALASTPSWCPKDLVCSPADSKPSNPRWMAKAVAERPENFWAARGGEALWLNRPQRMDYRTQEITQSAELRIQREGQEDQVLEVQGRVRPLSAEWVLVSDKEQSHLLRSDGTRVHTFPLSGEPALSPDGSTLLLDEVLIDVATGEMLGSNTATRCRQVSWDAGGAYCKTDIGLLHHPHPAGEAATLVPPGGWEAYGRMEIQVPELPEGQSLFIEGGAHQQHLPAGEVFELWIGPHIQEVRVVLISEELDPTPEFQRVPHAAPAPGESVSLTPQLRPLEVRFAECGSTVQARGSKGLTWAPILQTCTLSLPSMLVGSYVEFEARSIPEDQWWRVDGWLEAEGDLEAAPYRPERATTLDYSGVPDFYGSKALTWVDEAQVRTQVGNTRSLQITGGHGYLVLRQGEQVLEHHTDGWSFSTLRLPPGTWTGHFINSQGSAPLTLGPESPDTVWLPEVAAGPTHQIRVTDADGLPVADRPVYVALDGQEPTWSDLPKDTMRLETDTAGRVQIPDTGWPMWAWGPGWMVRLEGESDHTVQAGPSPATQRGINARLTPTPYGLQVSSSVCVEQHWLEKGDTLTQACGISLAGRSERALEELLGTSPTQSCPVQVLRPNGTQIEGTLSAADSSPLTIPSEPFPERPPYDTPAYDAWREAMVQLAPSERCGPPLSAELLGKELAVEVITPGDPTQPILEAPTIEVDYVVWVPAGFPVLTRLDGVQTPEEWPFSVPAGGTRALRIPRGVIQAAKDLGLGAQFRVWFPMSTKRYWMVADVAVRGVE